MLNRRHIRVKVMQSVYAVIKCNNDDLSKEEKYLKLSMAKVYDLYVLLLNLLVEIRNLAEKLQEIAKNKHLATSDDINPNRKFVDNQILQNLKNNSSLESYIKNSKLTNWKLDDEYVRLIWDAINGSKIYRDYISSGDNCTFEQDVDFITNIYKEIIAPNENLFDYFESQTISWVDDIPFLNTWILKNLHKINPDTVFNKDKLFKNDDDEKFAIDIFRKIALHHTEFNSDIDKMTPNWDTDRIAEIDFILMKMALVEFMYFPSIPTRVTINEYIEIAKDYSTAKSSFFINGVLDKLLKEYSDKGKIKKIGRGLL